MIKHVLRQERHGGYWLIRDEGRSIELSDAQYNLLASLYEAAHGLRESLKESFGPTLPCDDRHGILTFLKNMGLNKPEAWATVRYVPVVGRLEQLPPDASAAPKRIYFEITRHCNRPRPWRCVKA
jgi:hypothetical protein